MEPNTSYEEEQRRRDAINMAQAAAGGPIDTVSLIVNAKLIEAYLKGNTAPTKETTNAKL